jgi:hypothetical protein
VKFHPDVVLVLSGRWETYDRYVNGRKTSLGKPDLDRLLAANFDRALDLFAGLGARVAMVTTPCVASGELPDGSDDPANDPARAARYNELLRAAVARKPENAQVVDLNALLCPGGRYTPTIGGQPVRASDGIHIRVTAGPFIAPLLLGTARKIAGLPERPTAATGSTH